VLIMDGTALVQEAQARHELAPTATAALGRALVGAVLMSCFRKAGETLQITFATAGLLKVRGRRGLRLRDALRRCICCPWLCCSRRAQRAPPRWAPRLPMRAWNTLHASVARCDCGASQMTSAAAAGHTSDCRGRRLCQRQGGQQPGGPAASGGWQARRRRRRGQGCAKPSCNAMSCSTCLQRAHKMRLVGQPPAMHYCCSIRARDRHTNSPIEVNAADSQMPAICSCRHARGRAHVAALPRAVHRHQQAHDLKCINAGTLAVVRTQPRSPVPFTGTIEVESGEVAEDLTQYMAVSEQQNTALALGVKLDAKTNEVIAAGGYLIQARHSCAWSLR
jgi:Hsp33 protein